MKIYGANLYKKNQNHIYEVNVSFLNNTQELWYSVDKKYANLVSDTLDAPLVALLLPAMKAGEDIYIDGTVSKRLYYNLSNSLQTILTSVIPNLKKVSIYPSTMQDNKHLAPGVATGFSAGIDSFSVLGDHHYQEQPEGFQLTHLLYNNIGAHTRGGEKLFRERYRRLIQTTEEKIGLPFIAINSNLAKFYKSFSFTRTHTLRNASVALLLQNGIGRFMYASAFHYKDVFVDTTHDIAHSDPIVLPLLSTNSLDILSTGGEYTRTEKTAKVAEIKDSYNCLDVCVAVKDNDNNCSICWKCKRTLLTLDIVGNVDKYGKVFDLGLYSKIRLDFIAEVILSNDYFLKEIKAYAKNMGYQFPFLSYIYAYSGLKYFVDVLKKLTKVPRKLKRSINRRIKNI